MENPDEIKCPSCGNTSFLRESLIIDQRTGKKASGSGTLVFGIILLGLAVFMLVGVIIWWNDPIMNVQEYMFLPIVLFIGAVPLLYSYFKQKKVKKETYKCKSCQKFFSKNELEKRVV